MHWLVVFKLRKKHDTNLNENINIFNLNTELWNYHIFNVLCPCFIYATGLNVLEAAKIHNMWIFAALRLNMILL